MGFVVCFYFSYPSIVQKIVMLSLVSHTVELTSTGDRRGQAHGQNLVT